MKNLLKSTLLGLIMLVPLIWALPANALLTVPFDPNGSGSYTANISGFQLVGTTPYVVNGVGVNIVTIQTLTGNSGTTLQNGDAFTEDFIMGVGSLYDASGVRIPGLGSSTMLNDAYVSLSFSGTISGLSGIPANATTPSSIFSDTYTTNITSATADMYIGSNSGYVAGDPVVADWNLIAADPVQLNSSNWGGAATFYSVTFGFVPGTVNSDFWDSSVPNLTLYMTTADGSVTFSPGAISGDTVSNPDTISIGWVTNGFATRFTAVPEPGTILLLGCGLIGLAAVVRKRYQV